MTVAKAGGGGARGERAVEVRVTGVLRVDEGLVALLFPADVHVF